MQLARPTFAMHPKRFGKAALRELKTPRRAPPRIAEDVRLFATTFVAGFVVVSILIA